MTKYHTDMLTSINIKAVNRVCIKTNFGWFEDNKGTVT